jgi:hypothetical protein
MMVQVNAPRSAFIDFPLGRQCGRPDEIDLQLRIQKDTLNLLMSAAAPGTLVNLEYQWDAPFSWNTYKADIKSMLEEEDKQVREWTP